MDQNPSNQTINPTNVTNTGKKRKININDQVPSAPAYQQIQQTIPEQPEYNSNPNPPALTQLLQDKGGPVSTIISASKHSLYINDHMVWSSFPLSERTLLFMKATIKCQKRQTYIDLLDKARIEKKIPDPIEQQSENKIVKIHLIESSHLEMDPNVIHPFVRVSILDVNTGEYLKKSTPVHVPIVTAYEKLTRISKKTEPSREDLDFIQPFATNNCDLRIAGTSRAKWNHMVLLNEDISYILNNNTVILFEILDFNKQLINDNSNKLDTDFNYRIAWGYLKVNGMGKTHLGLTKIQLYRYKFKPNAQQAAYLKSNFKRVPFVYYDFMWPNKEEYGGYLTVQINGIDRPICVRAITDCQNIFEIEEEEENWNLQRTDKFKPNIEKEDLNDPEVRKKQMILMRRRRWPANEPCNIPNRILFRFQTSAMGCMRLTFSPNGNTLAAACTNLNSKTIIKLFDTENGSLRATLKGHKNIIHDLDWCQDSVHLVSCSSDFTCKLWRISEYEISGEVEEDDSEKFNLIYSFPHPSYVYSAKVYPEKYENGVVDKILIATACFDAKVRLWVVKFNTNGNPYEGGAELLSEYLISTDEQRYDDFQNLLDHRHPNTLRFDMNGRLYIGDSLGSIHIWDVLYKFDNLQVSKIATLMHPEFQGDPINCINLVPDNTSITIHTRDNCIRLVDYGDLRELRIAERYFGSKSSKYAIKSCTSPDGQYILSGSEDGKPYLFDVTSGELFNTDFLETAFLGSVSDTAWNQQYHMFAVAGFGDEYPILVYMWERSDDQGLEAMMMELQKNQDYENNMGNENLAFPNYVIY